MKLSDVSLNIKVIRKNVSGIKPMIGEIVSTETKKSIGGGQFQVLVHYERESSARWVAGGNLTKVDW